MYGASSPTNVAQYLGLFGPGKEFLNEYNWYVISSA